MIRLKINDYAARLLTQGESLFKIKEIKCKSLLVTTKSTPKTLYIVVVENR